tara:strand:- start:40313 stop:41263 length:951 start_codon:yes stop_codon:yes gene_type:complete
MCPEQSFGAFFMTIVKSMSEQGEVALIGEEGEVLKAYRDIAGFWTIGVGLTAGSGVIKPKAGMVITRAESRRLLRLALARNYEPRVLKAIPTDQQHVFDGATMFDFNTGAIDRASWVPLFLKGAFTQAGEKFRQWCRAGGKVVPGLKARREREWALVKSGIYPAGTGRPAARSAFIDHWADFKAVGFDPSLGEVATVTAFQRKHKLTVDGIIGPATRAAIVRALSAKAAGRVGAAGASGGAVAGGGVDVAFTPAGADAVTQETAVWALGGGITIAVLVLGGWLIWHFRGPLFVWLPEPIKDWFEAHGVVLGRRVRT